MQGVLGKQFCISFYAKIEIFDIMLTERQIRIWRDNNEY